MDSTRTDLFTPSALAPERRHYPRYSVRVQIEIHQEDSDVPMRLETTDFSRGGCYLQLMIPLHFCVRLQATLWLDGVPVVVRGLVVTRHPQFGNGIMFVEFKEGTKDSSSAIWTESPSNISYWAGAGVSALQFVSFTTGCTVC